MSKIGIRLASVSLLALSTACGQYSRNEELPSGNASATADAPAVTIPAQESTEYGAFEIEWQRKTAPEVATRARQVAELVAGTPLPAELFRDGVPANLPDSLRFQAGTGSAGTLDVAYYSRVDELRVSNYALLDDISSPKDVGESVARTIFEQTFEKLASAGLVTAKDFEVTAAEMSRTVTSMGSAMTEGETEVVNSYDFLARRAINGIPFVNAGVRVSIHRGGKVAAIRVGGAHPISVRPGEVTRDGSGLVNLQGTKRAASTLTEVPAGSGFTFRGGAAPDHYRSRFKRDFATGAADRNGVMYMLPLSLASGVTAVVEPLFVFSYSNRYGDVASRRRYIGYSLRDPAAAPVDLSERADPSAKGDSR